MADVSAKTEETSEAINAGVSIGVETPDAPVAVRESAKLEGVNPVHFRVTWTDSPSENATISWSTAKPAKKALLKYRVKGSMDKESTLAPETGQFIGGETKLYFYHAPLTELQAMTAYEFQIFSDDKQSKKMYFVTAPDDDRPLSILCGGDSRSDKKERRRVNSMLSDLVSQSYANENLDDDIFALAHGGDYVASGKKLEQWTEWLSANELTMGADGRMLPIIPARGNHDSGTIFNDVFHWPADDTNYYGVNLTSQVRLVTLNTEISTAGKQQKWLRDELRRSRPLNRWLLVQYHRPAYPAVKSPGSALQSWVPSFEKYNVDLVCEMDGHNIKRTVPIRGNVRDPTGIVYIGEGGLGVSQRTPKKERWYLKDPGFASAGSHIFVLTFEAEKLTGRCVELNGKVADTFLLKPRVLDEESKK